MKNSRQEGVKLEILATDELPESVMQAIGEMSISIKDAIRWQESKPRVAVQVKDGYMLIEIRQKISVRRIVAYLASTGIFGYIALIMKHALHL